MAAPRVASTADSAAVVAAGSEQNEVVRQLLQEVLRQLPAPNELRALDHASYAMLDLVQRKRLRDPEDAMEDAESAVAIHRVLRKLRRLRNLVEGAVAGECPICMKSFAEQARATPACHHVSTHCCGKSLCCDCLLRLGRRTCPFCRAEWEHPVECALCLFGSSAFD